MSVSRTNRSRSSLRAFRPTVGRTTRRPGGSLRRLAPAVPRHLPEAAQEPVPQTGSGRQLPAVHQERPGDQPELPGHSCGGVQTVRGGQAVNVVAVDGIHYRIQLAYISNTAQTSAVEGPAGAYSQGNGDLGVQPRFNPPRLPTDRDRAGLSQADGKIGIIVDGSNSNTELTINPLPSRSARATPTASPMARPEEQPLQIGQVTINSGKIGAIEGFHTADLSGPMYRLAPRPSTGWPSGRCSPAPRSHRW